MQGAKRGKCSYEPEGGEAADTPGWLPMSKNIRFEPPGFFTQGQGVVNSVVVRTASCALTVFENP
jgi:hypothetical protein